ncbi:hypothetical protein EVAR_8280_1 [Eumeta japonica]|uniref:Uncharacterized protein n=1 Tax=Eumeta variegata TaxID=151549 RepID=A0A4C1Y9Q5_EUMVA|nr:hypothetical protein EVAR_8280_1 [Eumeta japonica]
MIAGAGWYVKNYVISRDLRVQTIDEYVRLQTRRLFDCADEGPIPSLHNLASHTRDRPTKVTRSYDPWGQCSPTRRSTGPSQRLMHAPVAGNGYRRPADDRQIAAPVTVRLGIDIEN